MKSIIKRLLFLISILTLAGIFVACGESEDASDNVDDSGANTVEDEIFELKLGTNLPSEHLIAKEYDVFADAVREATDGRLDIEVFYSEQLGNERDVTEGISNDTVDMAVVGTGEMARHFDPLLIFDAPYVFENVDHLLAFANGEEGNKIWDEFADKTNIRNLGIFYYGSRHVTTSDIVAETPEDFHGVKLRVPDQPMPLAYGKALGANPTPMELGELYLALQQKVVDGQENPLPTIVGNGFDEVQNNIILTGHVIAATGFIISDNKYQSLPEDLRAVLDQEVENVVINITDAVLESEEEILEELKEKGLNIVEPDVEAFKQNATFIYEDFESEWGEGLYETIQEIEY